MGSCGWADRGRGWEKQGKEEKREDVMKTSFVPLPYLFGLTLVTYILIFTSFPPGRAVLLVTSSVCSRPRGRPHGQCLQ